jgi:hypothetical protein
MKVQPASFVCGWSGEQKSKRRVMIVVCVEEVGGRYSENGRVKRGRGKCEGCDVLVMKNVIYYLTSACGIPKC